MQARAAILAALTVGTFCASAFPGAGARGEEPRTIGELLRRGTPTFVLGTGGGVRSERAVRAQVDFVRDLLFPNAHLLADTALDVTAGPEVWPEVAVLYGGEHLNAALRALGPGLPLRVQRGRVEVAGERFEGEEFRVVALLPAEGPRAGAPAHPAFALYAGAGDPGIEEINALADRGMGFVVGDRFGALAWGRFVQEKGGLWRGEVVGRAERPRWRVVEVKRPRVARELRVRFLADSEGSQDEHAVASACARGVARALARLGLPPSEVSLPEVHVYPSREAKRSLTGNGGDGHSDSISATLHLLAVDPAEGGVLEGLVAHEATHVIVARAVGTPGTAALGEGLAVWVAGEYGGRSLQSWASRRFRRAPQLADFLGLGFRRTPERESYPLAGLLVGRLVDEIGIERLLAELYPATRERMPDACERAGLARDALAVHYAALLGD